MIPALLLSVFVLHAAPPPAEAEVERIRAHLFRAESVMRARDLTSLTTEQRARRADRLEELRAYRERGVFPMNRDFPTRRMPYFVDAEGTRCAMADLIERSGGSALVQRVAKTANNARVQDLAGDAELKAWLEENGITVEEAAMVQPSYSGKAQDCICGDVEGVGVGTIEPADASYSAPIRLSRLEGTPPANARPGDAVDVLLQGGEWKAGDAAAVAWKGGALWNAWAAPGGTIGCTPSANGDNFVAYPADLRIGIEEAVPLMFDTKCAEKLVAKDPRWGQTYTDNLGQGRPNPGAPTRIPPPAADGGPAPAPPLEVRGCGCTAAGPEALSGLGFLAAAVLLRRVRRRRTA